MNKAIKRNINTKLMTEYSRLLVNTGSCQVHVVHNSFKKGVEACISDTENLCIDLFNIFNCQHLEGKICSYTAEVGS